MKTTYLVTLALDEEWFKAIDKFTADVHEGELCSWIAVDTQVDGDEDEMVESTKEEVQYGQHRRGDSTKVSNRFGRPTFISSHIGYENIS